MKLKYPKLTIILETNLDESFKYIFNDEANHIAFMSLFQYMILSNSTYSHFSADMNVTENQLIIPNALYTRDDTASYQTRTMSFLNTINNIKITWNISFYAYYLASAHIGCNVRIKQIDNPKSMLITIETQHPPKQTIHNKTFIIFDNKRDYPEIIAYLKATFPQCTRIATYTDIIKEEEEKTKLINFANTIIELNANSVIFIRDSIQYKYTLMSTSSDVYLQAEAITGISTTHAAKYHKYKTKYNQIKTTFY